MPFTNNNLQNARIYSHGGKEEKETLRMRAYQAGVMKYMLDRSNIGLSI